ncbi:crossover junction endodeoxyribonuclease RuvC [Patescibacteria group bacterium]|nr:crossover junction endodeoxyribonuclease RuvC [Patescibacteria group bacterium]
MQTYKIILGIDPGLATTGWGVIKNSKEKNEQTLIDYGTIDTKPGLEFPARLKSISDQLNKIIKKTKPEVIAVEKLFFSKNIKTATEVGHARGVILLTAAQNNLPIKEFTPPEIKQSVSGYGGADKQQIQTMTKCILKMQETPKPDDAADALATACTCATHLNSQLYETS